MTKKSHFSKQTASTTHKDLLITSFSNFLQQSVKITACKITKKIAFRNIISLLTKQKAKIFRLFVHFWHFCRCNLLNHH